MAQPHPPSFYTSRLTPPLPLRGLLSIYEESRIKARRLVRRTMRRLLFVASVGLLMASFSYAVALQGMIADWNCTQEMVRHGREKTLKEQPGCSLTKNFRRSAYGLITDDKKFYKIDPEDNDRVI